MWAMRLTLCLWRGLGPLLPWGRLTHVVSRQTPVGASNGFVIGPSDQRYHASLKHVGDEHARRPFRLHQARQGA